MRNNNVIMISELVKDVGESIVANTNYGISVQVQRKSTGNLVQGRRLCDRDFNRNRLDLNRTLSITQHSAWLRMVLYDELKKAVMHNMPS
jgi:hypothetical protein